MIGIGISVDAMTSPRVSSIIPPGSQNKTTPFVPASLSNRGIRSRKNVYSGNSFAYNNQNLYTVFKGFESGPFYHCRTHRDNKNLGRVVAYGKLLPLLWVLPGFWSFQPPFSQPHQWKWCLMASKAVSEPPPPPMTNPRVPSNSIKKLLADLDTKGRLESPDSGFRLLPRLITGFQGPTTIVTPLYQMTTDKR